MSNSNPANPTTTTMSINNNSNQSTNQVNTNTSTTTNNPNQKDHQQQQQQQQQQQSQDPGQQTSIIELESQFILRMPVIKGENGAKRPHPATAALREALAEQSKINDEQEDPLKGRLFVEINPETRKGRVRFDDEVFDARLVDLPCIVESLKTKDKKMFYKTADICQMLVCKTRDDEWSDDDTSAEMAKAKKKGEVVTHAELLNRKYQWAHGITPPLKNVRRKRFRKVAKKRVIDYAEIEREVKQLFRTDREAANITYEVVYMEGEGPTASNEAGGEDNEGGLDNEEDANDRKTTTHKYDWDEDSMLSPDENSSSFMVRRTGKKSTAATASSLAGPSSSNNNKDMLKKDQSMLDLDESSSKATTAQSADQKQNREDTNMSASQQLDRSALDDRTKNYEDETIDDEASNLESTSNFKSMFVKEVLGDLSSSDEEDDEDEEEEDQNEDEEKANNEQSDDSNSNMESVASKSKSNYNEFEGEEENAAEEMDDDETMDDDENTNAGADFSSQGRSKSDELNTRLNKLYGDLHRIQEERVKREDEIKHISNPGLKVRLSSRLNNLIDEENKTKNEIEELKSLMEDQ